MPTRCNNPIERPSLSTHSPLWIARSFIVITVSTIFVVSEVYLQAHVNRVQCTYSVQQVQWYASASARRIQISNPQKNENIEYRAVHIATEKLVEWLEQPISGSSHPLHARFILGPAVFNGRFDYDSERFPGQDCYPSYILPFSGSTYTGVENKLQLPISTPWLLESQDTHFHRYLLDLKDPNEQGLGFTMRLSSRGILEMDVAASVSWRPSTGIVSALLQGCTSQQQLEIGSKLREYKTLTVHPLLLPLLLVELKLECIEGEESRLWNLLVTVESMSKQTGAPVVGRVYDSEDNFTRRVERRQEEDEEKFHTVAVGIVGVIQRTSYAETHAKALLLQVKEIFDGIAAIEKRLANCQTKHVALAGEIISDKLRLLEHRLKVLMGDITFVEKRAQAQQSAVYNFIAQRNAKTQRDLATLSSQIARASRRDSSAMKAIAVLTMLFLPGTFMATFFAMPVLDYPPSATVPSAKRSFWLYWAVTVPLTTVVLAAYIAFVILTQKKQEQEDDKEMRKHHDKSRLSAGQFHYE